MGVNSDTVQASATTFEILVALKRLDGAGVTQLANYTGLPKSTVYNHLRTLIEAEFIVRDGELYRIGLRFLDFGVFVSDRVALVHAADSELKELATSTGELATLMVEEHSLGVYVAQEKSDRAVNTNLHIGKRVSLHQTASGKAMLAYSPRSHVEEIIDQRGLNRMTANTITDEEKLFKELDETKERGYAIDDQEWHRGLRCIAAPIRDEDGHALGAISIAGPMSRVQGERFEQELPDAILSAANVIELNIEYDDKPHRR